MENKDLLSLYFQSMMLFQECHKEQFQKKMLKGKTAGHSCVHHLFGAESLAAAIHIKNWLRDTGTP